MVFKKRVSAVLVSMLVLGGIITSNTSVSSAYGQGGLETIAHTLQNNAIDTVKLESISDEDIANKSENLVKTRSEQKLLIHNDGKPLNGNFVVEKNDGNIYAIYLQNVNGVEYRATLGAHDSVEITPEDIEEFAVNSTTESEKAVNQTIEKSGGEGSVRATYGDTVKLPGGTYTYNTGINKKGNNTYNGKPVSVWDITSFNQGQFAAGLFDTITRIDVKQTNQHIVSYGPKHVASGSSGNVTLNGPSSATKPYAWSFSLPTGIKVRDSSSLANKYARWTTSSGVVKSRITSEYGLRVTNAVGNFVVKPSHSVGLQGGARASVPVINHVLRDR